MRRFLKTITLVVVMISAAICTRADSVFSTERQALKVADGIYIIRHKDPFPGWVHGNTTVIIDHCHDDGISRRAGG